MWIKPKSLNAYAWYLKPFFWNQKRKYGNVLDAGLMWARVPKLFLGVATLYGMIDRRSSLLQPDLRSLLTVRISQINHCSFCVDINSATLMKRGASLDKVDALGTWRESDIFTDQERDALEYAEAMTRTDDEITADLRERLQSHFSDDQIVELTGLIAFQNMSSKFNSALDVPPQGFCKLPNTQEQS